MRNRTAVANAIVAAVCTLAIALLTIGMGVSSTWAGSDTRTSCDVIFQPVTAAGHPRRSPTLDTCQRIAQKTSCTCPARCPNAACTFDDNSICQCPGNRR